MPNLTRTIWLFTLVAQLTVCAGCSLTDQQLAERQNPFVESTPTLVASTTSSPAPVVQALATVSTPTPMLAVLPALTKTPAPLPLPLPAVITPVAAPVVAPATAPVTTTIKLMSFEVDRVKAAETAPQAIPAATVIPAQAELLQPAPTVSTTIEAGVYPIDLANALGLGGADNLQVRLARTRLFQAQARHLQAKALWLPSLRFGLGYNKHDGRLQETSGNVIEVDRNSLFYGGGFGLGGAPLTGGAGGPPRLMVNLSLADAYFKPLAACQEVAASGAAERIASNNSLAEIAIGYHSLLEAHGRVANATAARGMAQNMVSLVENFEREGFSSQAEVSRARTALARWRRDVAEAQRMATATSARLARVLRLPPQVQLVPVEEHMMPIDFVDGDQDLDSLIALARQSRPEVQQQVARREAACFRVQEEKWRPWIPNVQAGFSGGGFGGGPSTSFPSASDRSDVDLLAVWEWQNMGLGNVARQRLRRGELHERGLELEALREQIAAEVVTASSDVASYREQMQIAQEAITAAQQSYELNEQRIRASEGLPIELLQSISALVNAQNDYTAAVASYNRSQYRLLRSLGNPAGVPGS